MDIKRISLLGVSLALLDTSKLTTDEIKTLEDAASPERRAYASKYRFERDRINSLAGEYLARLLLSEKCGLRPGDVSFSSTGERLESNAPCGFNISHTEGLAVCGVYPGRVGVDAEKIREIKLLAAKRFASEREAAYIGDSSERLLKLWTLKEAYFKYTGEGITADLKSAEFDCENGFLCSDESVVTGTVETDGYYISVCRRVGDAS